MKTELTVEQDKTWTKLFEIAANGGASDAEADEAAWEGLREEYPELEGFDGCR